MYYRNKLIYVFIFQDIVTESASFDLKAFIPLLRERVYARDPYARQFIVSWVTYKLFVI